MQAAQGRFEMASGKVALCCRTDPKELWLLETLLTAPPHPTPSSAASPSSKGALAGASLCLPWAVLSWSIALISSWELMIQWYHLSTLTLAIVGEFTPQKSANVANQGFSFPGEPIYQHTSECSLCIINVECIIYPLCASIFLFVKWD